MPLPKKCFACQKEASALLIFRHYLFYFCSEHSKKAEKYFGINEPPTILLSTFNNYHSLLVTYE